MKLAALTHSALLLGFTLLFATAADLPVHAAKGEGQSFLRDKRPVIQFPAKSPKGTSATWDLENPIQPGWHTVEIQFGPERNCRKLVDLAFLDSNATTLLAINLYHVPSKTASRPLARFGIYLTNPCNQVQWIKNQSRDMASAPLLGLSIRPGRTTPADASMEVLPAPSQFGRLLFPEDLGNGIIRALASKPVSLKWTQRNGKSFTTPAATETTAFLESDLHEITITDGTLDRLILERRFESPSPASSKGLEKPIIPLIQDGRHLHTLKISGSGLDPKSVRLADFPNGARMAAVLSWDDGVAQDKRAAEIMHKWGWRASFFFNRNSVMVDRWKELEDLGMEVASHSWSHPFYPLQSPSRCLDESMLMRRFLESKVGHPVISFAYPFNYGAAYDSRGDYVLRANRESGYLSGRSTMNGPLSLDNLGEPLAMKTDAHFLAGPDRISSSWKRAAETTGGIFYIWGHTYEIVGEADWTAFETMLKEYGRRPETWYASQGDLMVWKHLRDHTKLSASGNSNELAIQLDVPSIHPWWAARVPIAITVPGKMTRATSGDQTLQVIHSDIQIEDHQLAH